MEFKIDKIKKNCRHFRGDIPCKPHKKQGAICVDTIGNNCSYYDPVDKRILIIKLGAIGDVIRTTPILRKLKEIEPRAEIWWLTLTPEVVPNIVDIVLPFTPQSLVTLQMTAFNIIYNLDKDKEACAICTIVKADVKKGFMLRGGKCVPIDTAAEHKYLTGIFDNLSKANTKSYQEEIFDICGFKFSGEEYIMPDISEYHWKLPKKKVIVGLNTGCGDRWTSRLWPNKYWLSLAKYLKKAGYVPLFLGGEQEHKNNLTLAKQSRAIYLGHFPLQQFMSLVNRCDLVVTAVTMALHIATGYQKKIVLFNNIFNKYEFELYGRGVILEPDYECDCFYSPTCKNNCMQYLRIDTVYDSIQNLIKQ